MITMGSIKVFIVGVTLLTFVSIVSSYPSQSSSTTENSDTLPYEGSSISSLMSSFSPSDSTIETSSSENVTISDGLLNSDDASVCPDGLTVGAWRSKGPQTFGDRFARGSVYFLALCYLFLGVSIVSDRFMAAIEVITSKEKEVKVRKPNGEVQIVVVRVWNETVANLTLMALGSSAPEILLSIIEIIGKGFTAGDLGPGTIVGSAAYNLFVIIAICVCVIPIGETRKIKHLRVFFVTALWSVFAYIWLYLILCYFSPGQVEMWEGLLTFMFFPATVGTAYIAERRLLVYKYISKEYRMNRHGVVIQSEAEALPMNGQYKDDEIKSIKNVSELTEEVKDFEDARKEYVALLKNLRKEYPQSNLEQLEIMAQEQMMNSGPKSRAFYRVQATRKMMGSGNIMRKIAERAQNDLNEVKAELQRVGADKEDDTICRVFFEPGHYTVMESCKEFEVRVVRRGDFSFTTTVNFETEDGSAEAGTDYVAKKGTIVFAPGVVEQHFSIEVIDDDMFEQDEHFYIRLSNVSEPAILATPKVCTVMILDDDHGGIFGFSSKDHELVESVGVYEIKVQRYSGARGKVIVPYWTEDGTAKAGKDYEPLQGVLEFDNNESE